MNRDRENRRKDGIKFVYEELKKGKSFESIYISEMRNKKYKAGRMAAYLGGINDGYELYLKFEERHQN